MSYASLVKVWLAVLTVVNLAIPQNEALCCCLVCMLSACQFCIIHGCPKMILLRNKQHFVALMF